MILYCVFLRVDAYIRNGWAGKIVDPDKKTWTGVQLIESVSSTLPLCLPGTVSSSQLASAESLQVSETGVDCVAGWKPLKQTFTQSSPLNFINAEIVNYFVVWKTVDDLPACDVKRLNSSALGLFRCGNVQDITVSFQNYIYIKASCLPEMRKDRAYKLIFVLGKESFDVLEAKCGCPAGKGPGKGPHASCKHIGALCYALKEYTRIGKCPEYVTYTEKLQSWNKPRTKNVKLYLWGTVWWIL